MKFGDDITSQPRLAKKQHFIKQKEKIISQECEFQVSICPDLLFASDIIHVFSLLPLDVLK